MTPPRVRGKSILVVEDEPEVATALARLLAIDGHRVDTAPDGRQALEKLGHREYDLILSDIKMPGLDGPAFYRELARTYPGMVKRVAFVTGDPERPETRDFLDATGLPCATKPITLVEIRRILARVVGGA